MKLPKDLLTEMATKPRLFLCEVDKQKICQLETTNLQGSFKFNAYSELSFTVGRTYTNIVTGKTSLNPFYDKIEGLRLVYLEGFGYFELQDPEDTSDGTKEVKNMTAYSLEYTLSQKYLEELNVNTGENNSIEVVYADGSIIPVTLYNPSRPELSLLHIALEKVPGWKIGHIDASLQTMSRTFEISRVSVYDFIVQDICDKFNCFAVFDTINNTINLYAEASVYKIESVPSTTNTIQLPSMYRFGTIGSVSINGYRTIAYEYNRITGILTFVDPIEKGSFVEITDGSQEQWKTDIYVTFDNLAEEVNVSYNTDDIKTVLTVKGADDLDIREVNMGLPYLIDISYYHNVDWMGQELYDAYSAYIKKCNDGQADYKQNSEEMWDLENYITYETQRLSLEYSIADNVNGTTVGTYYVRGGTAPNYYYTAVKLPDEYNINVEHYYTLSGSDLDETKFSNLYEAFKTYFISQDEKDTSEIEKLKDSFAFMENNTIDTLSTILKNATSLEQKNTAILAFLDEMWDQLGLTPLKSLYYTSYQKIKEVNEEAGWNDPSNENYWAYYPVTLVVSSLDKEITDRENTITELQEKYNILQKANNDIADGLVMANNFTLDQLIKLSAFLREDEYTDDNFIQTETDTIASIMQTKQELLECGRIELSKLCEPKLQFSMNMANIYALPEFESIINQFQLGNIIRIKLRDARLETLTLVGNGQTTSFNVPMSLDEVKKISFSNNKKIPYEYNSKTGTLIFNEAPDNGTNIEVTLVKYYIKQSRLLQVDINFEDFSDFSCEFGELTSLRTPSSIHADLLAGAMSAGKSVASNASYWNKGTDIVSALALQIQAGLLDAATVIKSIDGAQGVEIDQYGIHLRKYDPITGALDPKEGWLVNNQFLYSDDNFKTTKSVFGEYTVDGETKWGLLAEAVMAGYIAGCTIEGGTINIGDGAFVVHSDGTVTMSATGNTIDGYAKEAYVDNHIQNVQSHVNEATVSVQIYSVNGDTFKDGVSEIELRTTAYCGITPITGDSYKWYYYDGGWIEISDTINLIVSQESNYAYSTIKCVMTYGGNKYEDFFALTDTHNQYAATIKFFNGTRIFGESEKFIIAYASLYKNGTEIDPLATTGYYYSDNTVISEDGLITTDIVMDNITDGELVYFIYKDNSANAIVPKYLVALGQYDEANAKWTLINESRQFTYTNSLYGDIDSKIIVIAREDVIDNVELTFSIYPSGDYSQLIVQAYDTITNVSGIMQETMDTINNVKQYMKFDPNSGLRIAQNSEKFYVNIDATEMGFYDNTDASNPNNKIVSIGTNSATIKNMVVISDNENPAEFNCNANFNQSVNIQGFVFQIESNGSFSLAISK